MTAWKRIRGALGMGVLWALGGFAVGAGIELLDNVVPGGFARQVDMWPQTLALFAFPHGVLFGALVALLGANRRLTDLSFRQFGLWGAAAGVIIGVIGIATGGHVAAYALTTGLSTLAGVGTLAAGRMVARREAIAAPDGLGALTDRNP